MSRKRNTGRLLERAAQAHQQGQFDEAGALYQRVLQVEPEKADAWNLAGVLAHQIGKQQTAIEFLQHAVTLAQVPDYYANLATALTEQGRHHEAEQAARHCLELDAQHVLAWNVLGNVLVETGVLPEAEQCFRRVLSIDDQHVDALSNLGRLFMVTGRAGDAEQILQRALAIQPDHFHAINNLGAVYRNIGKYQPARKCFESALRVRPDAVQVLVNLGNTLRLLGEPTAAEEQLCRALEVEPTHVIAWNSLGVLQQDTARVEQAMVCFQQALTLDPRHAMAGSNYLFGLNLSMEVDRDAISQAHREWGQRQKISTAQQVTFAPRDAERKLRIGYVSPDFRQHALTGFFEPLLAHHDRTQVEVYCYADVLSPDTTTLRLQQQADAWRSLCGVDDRHAAEMIRGDEMDILVDLAGHTANNRLPIFAHRAAPVQVSMLGYLNTTGLEEVDYYISDAVRDPVEEDHFYTERVVRLPDGGCCWQAPADAPAVTALPYDQNGFLTFGSMHRTDKLTTETIQLWASILQKLPASRLLIFHNSLRRNPTVQSDLLGRFGQVGIEAARIDLAWDSEGEYLPAYAAMDVQLEATPWASGTTALDSMWMGVPLPTIYGDRPASRATASLLHRLDEPTLVAHDFESYLACVTELAGDIDRLRELRQVLRGRMQQTVGDHAGFVRQLEHAYRQILQEVKDVA